MRDARVFAVFIYAVWLSKIVSGSFSNPVPLFIHSLFGSDFETFCTLVIYFSNNELGAVKLEELFQDTTIKKKKHSLIFVLTDV